MMKTIFFTLSTLMAFSFAAGNPVIWEDLAISDCNGGMSLFPSSPVS
jgi:hypothetical protein